MGSQVHGQKRWGLAKHKQSCEDNRINSCINEYKGTWVRWQEGQKCDVTKMVWRTHNLTWQLLIQQFLCCLSRWKICESHSLRAVGFITTLWNFPLYLNPRWWAGTWPERLHMMIMATPHIMGSRGTPEPPLPHCAGRSFLRVLKGPRWQCPQSCCSSESPVEL